MSSDEFLPSSRSQANKWTKAVRDRLPDLIAAHIQPVLEAALAGNLKIVPEGVAREALALGYANMLADAVPFDFVVHGVRGQINGAIGFCVCLT
jgi:hypothetical protein